MKLIKLKSPFWSLFVVALLVGLPFYCYVAQARGGGGGFHGGGGFSGGSFRGGGGGSSFRPEVHQPESFHPGGPPSGGPHPGGPPPGGPLHRVLGLGALHLLLRPGISRLAAAGGPTYWPGWGAGVAAGLAVGAVVSALPYAAERLVIAGQPYYVAGGTYYQPCYQGTDVNYCVVPDPTQ